MKNLDQTYNSKYRTTSGYTNMICQKERAKMKVRKPIVKQPFLGEIVTVCTYLLHTNPWLLLYDDLDPCIYKSLWRTIDVFLS
jgi:hypothetical protein